MLFCKKEKKSKSPYVIMALTVLATIGVISLTNEGKRLLSTCMCNMKNKATSLLKKEKDMVENVMDNMMDKSNTQK
jgi:hypothetical protein